MMITYLTRNCFLQNCRVSSRGYFEGVEGNLRRLPDHYPGWTIRLHLDLSIAHQQLKGDNVLITKPYSLP